MQSYALMNLFEWRRFSSTLWPMMTIRPTKMLARRLRLGVVPDGMPVVTNRVADWCAHEFMVSRWVFLIFCNTASLYPVLTEARGVTDDDALSRRLAETLRLNLADGPHAFAYGRWIAPATAVVEWAAIPDRSVLGSINDLIFAAKWGLRDGMSPLELSRRLAQTPLSILGMNSPERVFPKIAGGEARR